MRESPLWIQEQDRIVVTRQLSPRVYDEGAITEKLDPFGASVREIVLKHGYKPLQDTQPYEKLLEDCIANNVDQIKLYLPKQMEQYPAPSPLQPLAVLAARKGHAEILQFCLDKGAVFDWNLERSTLFGANSRAMHSILSAEKQKLPGGTSAKGDSKWDGELLQKFRLGMLSVEFSIPPTWPSLIELIFAQLHIHLLGKFLELICLPVTVDNGKMWMVVCPATESKGIMQNW